MLVRCCWPCQHDPRRIGAKHPFVHQLLGVIVEEALAKRPIPSHQIHHGTTTTSLLSRKLWLWEAHSTMCHFLPRNDVLLDINIHYFDENLSVICFFFRAKPVQTHPQVSLNEKYFEISWEMRLWTLVLHLTIFVDGARLVGLSEDDLNRALEPMHPLTPERFHPL